MAMARLDTIVSNLDKYLRVEQFRDHNPVGLQVEGASTVKKVVTGVSLSMELLERAVAARAQMVIVHHGTFWNGESPVVRGPHKRRLRFLLENDLSLLAYHLPLDAHPVVGNNAQILKMIGARVKDGFGVYHGTPIGFMGELARGQTIAKLMTRLRPITVGEGICVPPRSPTVKRLGVVSGGAGGLFVQALEAQLDLFITGEAWEPAQALARESGVGYLALGHYNSEKPGIQALGQFLKKRLGLAVEFVDVPNPA